MRDVFAVRRGVTKHGLEVFVKTVRTNPPQACIGLLAFAGMRQDPPDLPGLSHAVEHALVEAKGASSDISGKRRLAISEGFLPENLGRTVLETAWWAVRGDANRMPRMMEFLNSLTRMAPERLSIPHLQAVLQCELAGDVDAWNSAGAKVLQRMAFPGSHPYVLCDNAEHVRKLTHRAILAHWRRYYTLPNMSLVVAGNVTFHEALAAAEAAFPKLPHDAGASRATIAPLNASPVRCGQFVIRLCDVLGTVPDDNVAAGNCSVWRMRTMPPFNMHQQRAALCMTTAFSACEVALRERLGFIYVPQPVLELFRDLRFCRIGVDAAAEHITACGDVLRQIPELVKARGKQWFEVEKGEMLMDMRLKQKTLFDLVHGTLMDLSVFGRVQTQRELLNVIETTTWADAVAGIEELFAADRSLMVTIVP